MHVRHRQEELIMQSDFFERQLSEPLIHAVFVVVSKSTFEIYVRLAPDWLGDFQLPKKSTLRWAVSPSASPFCRAPALAVPSTHWAGALPNDRILSIPEKVLYRTWRRRAC